MRLSDCFLRPCFAARPSAHRAFPAPRPRLPIENVLICCNENRSFDHYFGNAPFAGAYGIPAGYSQPTGVGALTVAPYDDNSPVSPNPDHDWVTIHGDWDQGKLDGFFTSGGIQTLSYTDGSQLGYYYSLFSEFTLCVNYFCSMLGPTFPNRLYLTGATSGGQTTDNIAGGFALTGPIILDLLDAHRITWKAYNIGGGLQRRYRPHLVLLRQCVSVLQALGVRSGRHLIRRCRLLFLISASGNLPQGQFCDHERH